MTISSVDRTISHLSLLDSFSTNFIVPGSTVNNILSVWSSSVVVVVVVVVVLVLVVVVVVVEVVVVVVVGGHI